VLKNFFSQSLMMGQNKLERLSQGTLKCAGKVISSGHFKVLESYSQHFSLFVTNEWA
jgi:hypothetical protein